MSKENLVLKLNIESEVDSLRNQNQELKKLIKKK